ncbi:Helicase protein MOM1 [Glycine soja]
MNAETLARYAHSRCIEGLTKECKDNAQENSHSHVKDKKGGEEVVCSNCVRGGVLLSCSGKGCQRRYHPSCVDPPLNYIPLGFWHCIWCTKKKMELGVHSVSKGVKSILDSREVVSKNKVMQREYFVTYHGLAHAHNRWIPESKLLLEAPKLLAKFKRKLQVTTRWKRDWSIPHRLLLKREIVFSKQNDQHFDGHGDNGSNCRYEWLVKWRGLGYDNATWELDDASFLTSPEGRKVIDDYESRRKRAERLSKNHFEANEERKASFSELSVLPTGDSPGFYNQHLTYVNKLRMCWHKGQSALIVDDQIDQERVMKVILFILSLNCNVRRPFLIISTSAALSVWETEFLRLAPSANLVVYKGDRDARSSIRALEFFNEHGGILFQILLSSSHIIVKDLHELRCITWEAIIIDECQQSRISGHLDDIKILKAEMRLLLVSGQIKEDQADYIKLLSLLKSGQHGSSIAQVETYFSASSTISNLKSQLEKYVVFKCKSGSTRFVEYWVPACLSHLQLEQYCSMLLSNLMLLCSGQKSDSVDALHDLIISIRKCCDHPYLLNPELQSFVTKGLPDEERLNIGIQASGKLQLLEKILLEARSRGLRVLILFQSTCGSGSIGDILDDVLCQRFGKDCYVRYDRGYTPKSKQAALDTFNDGESGKFVFLMENRACLSSVKLSSVDTVILFDSDLEPQNDLRGLQRMSISSQFKQITVFRLYSFFTVEEKILMLAKEGIALDSNVRFLSQSICPTLLKWGASYLFNKLDDLHASVVSTPDTVDMSLLCDTTSELSSQLVCGADDTDCHGWSFISRIQQNGGEYARDVLLPGERIMKSGGEPCGFSWSDLEGRHPKWKFLPVSSQRIRNTVKHFDYGLRESECEKYTFIEKRTASKDNVDPKRRKVSKDNADPEWSKWTMNKVDPKRRKVSNDVVDSKGREVSRNIVDSKYWKTRLKSKKNTSVVNRANKSNGHPLTNETTGKIATNMQFSEKKNPPDIRNLPKPDISGLCDILRFSKKVKAVAMRILEHIFKHYNVNCQEVSTVQAFEISVCWLAACLLEHEIDMKDSLALAKLYLNFDCKEEEATDVYSELWKHVKDFSNCVQNGLCVEKCNRSGASDSNMPELNDLAEEEKQKDFLGTCVSKLVKSVTNELNLQMKSPTTVVSQDLSCTHEICLSPNTPGSFPVEGDAISMESGSEDDRVNAITLITAEDSSVDHGSNDVNPVTGSLERQSPIRSTDITQSDGNVFEDPQILVNEVVAIDNGMNMSTHSAQLDSVEADAGTSASTAVPEVRRWYSVMSPVCDESTALKFPETTLPYMQPSDSNLWPLPQMAMSAIPSFPENNAASTVMPLDDIFRHSGEDHRYIHEAEVILEAPKDLNSSFVSPVIPQPFTSVPMNENATHAPHGITIPGFMNSDYSEAHSVTSEVSHLAYTDPLLGEMSIIENMNEEAFIDLLPIEMERIEKEKEEAFKIHEQKILQLQSDYEKEVEKLSVKYKMLLQNVNTEVALKRTELETQCELVLRNKVLAQVWTHNLDSCEGDVVQCTEQEAMPSSHKTAQD